MDPDKGFLSTDSDMVYTQNSFIDTALNTTPMEIIRNQGNISSTLKHAFSEEATCSSSIAKKKARGAINDTQKRLTQNRYGPLSKGSFELYLEKIEDNRGDKTIFTSEIKIGKTISKLFPFLWKSAFNLKALGTHKFTVILPDGDSANKLVDKVTSVGENIIKDTL